MKSAEQAGAYIRKLREILRRIGASDGNMDEGSLRCDVNVSINKVEEPWGVRCEIKNLNSIKFVMRAIGKLLYHIRKISIADIGPVLTKCKVMKCIDNISFCLLESK